MLVLNLCLSTVSPVGEVVKQDYWMRFLNFKIDVGVANGKCETLRDGETSVFLCEPETF